MIPESNVMKCFESKSTLYTLKSRENNLQIRIFDTDTVRVDRIQLSSCLQ